MLPQPTTATPSFSLRARALRIFGTPKSWAPAAAPASAALCLRKRRRLVLVLVLMVLSLSEKRKAVFVSSQFMVRYNNRRTQRFANLSQMNALWGSTPEAHVMKAPGSTATE